MELIYSSEDWIPLGTINDVTGSKSSYTSGKGGYGCWAISANAKNPELAKEFLRFLYTEDSVKLFAEKANGIYALKKANEMVKGIVTDGVYNMNDIYQEGTFMVFGWDAMPDTSKVVIADSVFNVASDVMNGDMTAEQWRDGIEAAFEEIAASK